MPAFRSEDMVAFAIPIQATFTQTRTSGNYGLIAVLSRHHTIEWSGVAWRERADSPTRRLKVVDQLCLADLQLLCQPSRVHNPRKIRGFDPSVAHRAGDSETCLLRLNARSLYELNDNFIQ